MIKYIKDKYNHVVFSMKMYEHVSTYILEFNNWFIKALEFD